MSKQVQIGDKVGVNSGMIQPEHRGNGTVTEVSGRGSGHEVYTIKMDSGETRRESWNVTGSPRR